MSSKVGSWNIVCLPQSAAFEDPCKKVKLGEGGLAVDDLLRKSGESDLDLALVDDEVVAERKCFPQDEPGDEDLLALVM